MFDKLTLSDAAKKSSSIPVLPHSDSSHPDDEQPSQDESQVEALRAEARCMFEDSFVSSKLASVLDYIRFVVNKEPEAIANAAADADSDADAHKKRVLPDKLVVVSEWTSMLEIVKTHLQREEIRFTEITGLVDINDRQEIVRRFNCKRNGPRVMLLSLKAGGVGLNLIGANHLCFVDVHWNPALEQQAADRIHRVGQTKNVFIKKYV